ncbi:DUF5686 and carboxypeptidase regulatory-like domain-containing protein [Reichenbachiella agarivorans]|uniref:DUF5686 and carboxypeptidase regulatory-like domain-containing protein n=1 Tax=Reichenbachiella agarivorans TaxID=2979464 RepID=A0ABY6CLL1_9BACT|nr:DUF5686 and carboxypeptidase-like regulatory domain-containing protein [Reichenbachiella agarivorans]UXP31404.1 DUF5686 and carboxypeptidase regulatory-like domain-containing protein [Reichenbachiella agarivorans]
MKLAFIFTIFLGVLLPLSVFAQQSTRIRGVVTDKTTGESLPFVNISFDGTTNGTTSDSEGKYYLETDQATNALKASYIGYEALIKPVVIGTSQTINFALEETSLQLEDVTISSKKLKYRNKDNPAVHIINRVIEHKESNKMTALDYYEYNKYEKVEFDFNNITEKFKQKRIMKDFQMVFDYMDTSDINGKTYLPIFLRETSSQVYYRKNPEREVEYRLGTKMTGFEDYFDNQGISYIVDKLYQDVDIYENNMNVLSQYFVSPISILAPLTYKYYIADTLMVEGEKLFKLSFQPRNQNDLAFIGSMYITTDSAYAVKKVDMRISEKTNLNYVEDLFIVQEFVKNSYNTYQLKTDEISMDFNITEANKMGIFGRRTVSYKDVVYDQKRSDTVYAGNEYIKQVNKIDKQPDEFWEQARHMELSKSEQGVYQMNEEVVEMPAFKRYMDLLTLASIGYVDFNKISIGPVSNIYSNNQVEGSRFRLGVLTTEKFSRAWQLEAYAAYGLGDEKWKYSGRVSHYFTENRLDHITAFYFNDLMNPGEGLQAAAESSIFSSFRRGVNDKRIYTTSYGFDYGQRIKYGFSYNVGASIQDLRPGGVLSFAPGDAYPSTKYQDQQIFIPIWYDRGISYPSFMEYEEKIEVTEVTAGLRYAPNEKIYQGRTGTSTIPTKFPIVQLKYWHGFDGLFDSDYAYDRVQLSVSKRFYVSPFGFTDVDVAYTQLWGRVPYPLLTLPRGNQTYSYYSHAFNMMNYLEFVSDRQVDLQLSHYFNGYIMNKIPLVKKLKLRSIVTYKMLFGSISDANNPDLNSDLPPYPRYANGEQATYALTRDPYMEASIGISNIFKVLRVDMVKRLTYLDRKDVPQGWAVRAKIQIEF